ncbi:MAG: response regulator transcription factor [Lachnospiraceae bacterium]|nr:response regulator transcription factor [Lachnospiraceae bacterium]
MSYRILIVEDDRGIAEAVAQQVALWEMQPRIVENFRDVMAEFAAFDPQLVLLDIVLPFFNGYHWCSEIRRVSKVPVLFLSSASDNMNIVMAMNMGGDDFIAKPFDQNVLIAKIQALLRRSYDFAQQVPVLCHRGAVLHTGEQTLHYEGEQIPLTKNEYRILLTLMTNKGRIVSREKLMEAIWKTDDYIDENTLSVNVNRLRKKLSAAGCPEMIETRVGEGYLLAM